jgi:hypothetical protein
LALNKRWNLGVTRLTTSLDLYNALNGSSVQQVVSAYGTARWTAPTQFLSARLLRITASLTF